MGRGEEVLPESATRLVVPDAGRGPGVLVLAGGAREAELVAESCARLARHGFVALGVVPPDADPDVALAPPTEAERARVDAALEQLFAQTPTEGARLGVVGFGRGAALALDAAARGGRIAALVAFGGVDALAGLDAASLAGVEAPLLALVGEKDPAVTTGGLEALGARLRREGAGFELRVLPGAQHGFFDAVQADRYDAVASRAAWDAALARLRAEL